MRLLTPQVEEIFRWFDWTHDVDVMGNGIARWRRVALPGPGSLAEQDAWLMAALDCVRDTANAQLEAEQRAAATRAQRRREGAQ